MLYFKLQECYITLSISWLLQLTTNSMPDFAVSAAVATTISVQADFCVLHNNLKCIRPWEEYPYLINKNRANIWSAISVSYHYGL